MLAPQPGWRRWLRLGLMLLALGLIITALARPQYGYTLRELKGNGVDVLFAVDVSRSMLASDLKPDRLTRAKLAVQDIISQSEGQRIGLIPFAGSAFLQCPLTLDYPAFRQSLDALGPDSIPREGTNLAAAIAEAQQAFEKSDNAKYLILITDGEDLEAAGLKQARTVKDFKIITVGVGTVEGAPVPVSADAGGQYERDASGQIVTSKLKPSDLQAIAEAGNGFYAGLQSGGLTTLFKRQLKGDGNDKPGEQNIKVPKERYQWPLGAGIILLCLEVLIPTARKRAATVVALLLVALVLPESLRAAPEGNDGAKPEAPAESAADKPEAVDPLEAYNRGIELYEAEKADEAIKSFDTAAENATGKLRAQALNNAGSLRLAQAQAIGDKPEADKLLEQAKADYEAALSELPDSKQIRKNHKRVEDTVAELKKLREEKKKQQEEQRKQQQQQSSQNQEGQQDQESQSQDSQQGNQQQQGSQSGQQGDNSQQGREGSENQSGGQSQSGQQQGNQQLSDQQGNESGQQSSGEEQAGETGDQQNAQGSQQQKQADQQGANDTQGQSGQQQSAAEQNSETGQQSPTGEQAESSQGNEQTEPAGEPQQGPQGNQAASQPHAEQQQPPQSEQQGQGEAGKNNPDEAEPSQNGSSGQKDSERADNDSENDARPEDDFKGLGGSSEQSEEDQFAGKKPQPEKGSDSQEQTGANADEQQPKDGKSPAKPDAADGEQAGNKDQGQDQASGKSAGQAGEPKRADSPDAKQTAEDTAGLDRPGEGAVQPTGEQPDGEPVGSVQAQVPGTGGPMTRQEAENLLRILQQDEKVLPAGKPVDDGRSATQGRDW